MAPLANVRVHNVRVATTTKHPQILAHSIPGILTPNMTVLDITERHRLIILNYMVPNNTFFSGSLFAAIFPISPRAARGLRAGPFPVQALPPRSVLVEARRFYKNTNPY